MDAEEVDRWMADLKEKGRTWPGPWTVKTNAAWTLVANWDAVEELYTRRLRELLAVEVAREGADVEEAEYDVEEELESCFGEGSIPGWIHSSAYVGDQPYFFAVTMGDRRPAHKEGGE